MQYPFDYNQNVYPAAMKDYRLDKSHIDAKLGENEPVKFDQPEGFIRDHVHECLQDIVEYTSCPAYNSVVPLSTHPHARTYLDELKYLLSNSNRASSEKIVMSSPMIDDELEALSDLMATSEWPIIIRSPTSLYAPNFFELSQVRNKTRKSEFHKVYPMTNRILLQDAYHPDFPKSRTSFSVQLEILTCTMNDPYSALQTVDCVGIATPNLAPQWLREATGVRRLLYAGMHEWGSCADLPNLTEHLAVQQALTFSGLLIDPHGMCHYDLMESGVRYVFYLDSSNHFFPKRLQAYLAGEEGGFEGLQRGKFLFHDRKLSAPLQAQWNVMRMTQGDAILFPPGAVRCYYSPGGSFSTSGSFLHPRLLHQTAKTYLTNVRPYGPCLTSFRPVILTTFEMIARALKAGDKSPVSNPQHLSAFLNVVQHLLNLEAKEAGTGSEDGASASTTIPERTKAAKKLLVEVKAFIERAPGGVRGLGKDAARR